MVLYVLTCQIEQSLSCLKFQTIKLYFVYYCFGLLVSETVIIGWLCKFSHITKLTSEERSVFDLSDHLHSQIYCSFYYYATEASPEMTREDYSVILDLLGSENDMIIC